MSDLNLSLREFKFVLRPENTYMKNKFGILPMMEGRKKTFPSTLEESKGYPFLVVSPGLEAVTSSRGKSELLQITKGDLVTTDAGETMVFLAAAKVSFAPTNVW